MKLLVTGGAGYIGSHTIVELLAAGHEVVAVDNFSNSHEAVFKRLETIAGQPIQWHQADVRDRAALSKIFDQYKFDAVIHFAAFKCVGESVEEPLLYYRNNLDSTLTLCEVMAEQGVKQLVFSSSTTVYGNPDRVPITEDFPLQANNPYGQTKLACEHILRDLAASDPSWQITLLRYFNPIGAHASGTIGEDPMGKPNNLLPYIAQVAVGRRDKLQVFGGDYDTPDGTCIRDYVHVVDVAKGHVKALERPAKPGQPAAYNLGTGRGYSVLEVIAAFERASGHKIAYEIVARRPGDIAAGYADCGKAKRELGWAAELDLDQMCRDVWQWQSQNPHGYAKA